MGETILKERVGAERGQMALSYEKFSALGRALRMDMGAMFSEAGATAKPFAGPVVTRSGEGVVYRGLSFSYEFLGTTAAGKQMSPILGTVHARSIDGPEAVSYTHLTLPTKRIV